MGVQIEGLHFPTLIQNEVSNNLDVQTTIAAEQHVVAKKAEVDNKVDEFNDTVLPGALADIGTRVLSGIQDYDDNRAGAEQAYNDNAQVKVNELNSVGNTKVSEVVAHADQKKAEVETVANDKISNLEDLHAAKIVLAEAKYADHLSSAAHIASNIDTTLGEISMLEVDVKTIDEYSQVASDYTFDHANQKSTLKLDIPRGERGFMPIVEFELDPVTWELKSKIVDYMETGEYLEWGSTHTEQLEEYVQYVQW